jgi:hypothetical protein
MRGGVVPWAGSDCRQCSWKLGSALGGIFGHSCYISETTHGAANCYISRVLGAEATNQSRKSMRHSQSLPEIGEEMAWTYLTGA